MAQKLTPLVAVFYAIGIAASFGTQISPLLIWLAFAAASRVLLGLGAPRYSMGFALRFIFVQSVFGAFTLMALNPLRLPLANRLGYVLTVSHAAAIMWFPWLIFVATGGYLTARWVMWLCEALRSPQ